MSSNGKQRPARPQIEIRQAAASPEEAAAITAAVEQFLRDTAPLPQSSGPTMSPWLEAGLLEGTRREPGGGAPWGSLSPPSTSLG